MARNRRWLIILGSLVALFVGIFWWAELYTEFLWFAHDAYPVVFQRRLVTKAICFLVCGAAVYLILALNLRLALGDFRPALRSVQDPDDDEEPDVRGMFEQMAPPLARWLPIVVGIFAGLSVAQAWQMWLPFIYGVKFGIQDPQFGQDVGFYIYRLGAYKQLIANLATLLYLVVIVVVAARMLRDQIRIGGENELLFDRPARNHILGLVAALLCVAAAGKWLDRYALLLKQRQLFAGAGYTDALVTIPAMTLGAILAVVAAAAALYCMRPGKPARAFYYAVGVYVVTTLLAGGLAPWLVQRVVVTPAAIELEAPYIARGIEATRKAFALDKVIERNFPAAGNLTRADLTANQATIDDIRIWDHRPLLRTFSQLQEIRQYYDVVDVDSDRYPINGRNKQVLIAARELNPAQLDIKAQGWINQHLEYTHGYGVIVSSASDQTPEGQPPFLIGDIPPVSVPEIPIKQPRIYFGEMILLPPSEDPQQRKLLPQQQQQQMTMRPDQAAARELERLNSRTEPDDWDYLLVGTRPEFDYAETVNNQEVKHKTTYDGKSGIPVGGFFRRLAFSLALHSPNLFLSSLVKPETKLLLHRQVTRRCTKAAPFLMWDIKPYPVLADGRLVWICEGYTFSFSYPYAEGYGQVQQTPKGPLKRRTWNYLRNSVKAVVDAYDGTIEFYAVDPDDPILKTFEQIYPGMFQPVSAAPKSIVAHFRYPQLLFQSQSAMYLSYHMTEPRVFYQQEDKWAVARQIDRELARIARQHPGVIKNEQQLYQEMDPYYQTLSLPGEQRPEFMLINAFTPFSAGSGDSTVVQRDNLIAWMGGLCDPERYGQLVVYRFPTDTNIYGPLQVEARIDQDDTISQQITLWDRGGSQVIRGNLLVIPIESSLLYVQPLYLESEQRGLPELKRIIVAYQDKVVMERSVAAALAKLFGGKSPSEKPVPQLVPTPQSTQPQPTQPPTAGVDPVLLKEAGAAYDASEQALKAGDWAAYDRERKRLGTIIEQLRGKSP